MKADSLLVLHAWHKACELSLGAMEAAGDCRDQALREALAGATLEAAAAIAASHRGRDDAADTGELMKAKGRCAEVRTHAYLAARVGEVSAERSDALIRASLELGEMLQAAIDRSVGTNSANRSEQHPAAGRGDEP